jgi:hypothetical protein
MRTHKLLRFPSLNIDGDKTRHADERETDREEEEEEEDRAAS